MANSDKQLTAKQVATAVLEKVGELLHKCELMKAESYKPQNSGKENAKPSEHNSKDAMQHADGPGPKGEIHPKETEVGAPTNESRPTPAPGNNPKEKAEGNNELAGTTPTQVGQDGKNKPGYDEMKGHLKLAKFIGRMEGKRERNLSNTQTQGESTTQHKEVVSGMNKSEDLAKAEAFNPAKATAPAATAAKPGSANSPTKTNTETGGSSPGGASTGGVGSGLGGAGTGGAATGGASTGGAGTVNVTISGSSSTDTSSGAGAKKGDGGGKPAAPITINISNVGGTTDAGNVASGDGPGASGSGGTAPNGFGGGGGGASPDEPKNFSTQGKDKMVKSQYGMHTLEWRKAN